MDWYLNKALNTPLSANRVIAEIVRQKKERGVPVIDMGQGSPTFPIHPEVQQAIHDRVDEGRTRYEPTPGDMVFREQIVQYLSYLFSAGGKAPKPHLTGENVIFTLGGSGAVYMAASLVGGDRHRILLPRPSYSNYPGPVTNTNAQLDYYDTSRENGYVPTYEQLREKIGAREKISNVTGVMVNFPGNPTGASLNQIRAKQFAHTVSLITRDFPNVFFLNDCAYLDVARPGEDYSFYPYLTNEAKQQVISLFSGSKGASLANYRVGALVAEKEAMIKFSSNFSAATTMGINDVGVAGYARAARLFLDDPARRTAVIRHYQSRLAIVADGLDEISAKVSSGDHKITNGVPGGGMFVYADLSHLIGHKVPEKLQEDIGAKVITSSEQIAKLLLAMDRYGYAPVACIHGEGFGEEGSRGMLRIAAIESHDLLRLAIETFKGLHQLVMDVELGAKPNYDRAVQILQAERQREAMERAQKQTGIGQIRWYGSGGGRG